MFNPKNIYQKPDKSILRVLKYLSNFTQNLKSAIMKIAELFLYDNTKPHVKISIIAQSLLAD